MRPTAISFSLLVAACASSPTDDNQPVDRACSVSDCFYQREVRDFEVIGDTTLIVYVGGQRCAYRVELDGTFCDMSFAPEIFFRPPPGRPEDSRICSYDRQVGVDGGPFTDDFSDSQPLDRFGQPRSQCRILSVASINDDELLELYVDRGVVAPPPPIGAGQIKVGEQSDREPAEEADAAENDIAPLSDDQVPLGQATE
jgi:Family of unknown function (DUF6491)